MTTTIDNFQGVYRFLSNFYRCPVAFEGALYPTSEHAFQAAKTLDPVLRAAVRDTPNPGASKRLGRVLPLREDWEDIKVDVMRIVLFDKFSRNPSLGASLLATGDLELVEANTWGDRFWGVCDGGENWLGRLLMEVRAELREQAEGGPR